MKVFRKLTALALSVTTVCAFCLTAYATPISDWTARWDAVVADASVVSLAPGAANSEMRLCWLSPLNEKQTLIYGKNADLSDGAQADISRVPTLTAQFSNRVSLTDLSENSVYYYRVNDGEIYSFKTGTSEGLTALFVSDIQIGRSGDYKLNEVLIHDTAGWDTALKLATAQSPAVSLILSSGDQAEIGASEKQYRAFLAPDALRSLPVATTVGNHEFYFPYLTWHFNNPNRWDGAVMQLMGDKGYYFTNSDTLFIVIDSNDPLAADHEALIEKAVNAYPDARWRVVMMHHSIYSCETGDEMPSIRTRCAPVFDKYNIDLVLSGHSHRYSRSYPMYNFEKTETRGTVYLESGCTSGSNPKASPETLPSYSQAGYSVAEPVYSILRFTDDKIAIETYAVRGEESALVDSGSVVHNERDDSGAHMDGAAASFYKAVSKLFALKRQILGILR